MRSASNTRGSAAREAAGTGRAERAGEWGGRRQAKHGGSACQPLGGVPGLAPAVGQTASSAGQTLLWLRSCWVPSWAAMLQAESAAGPAHRGTAAAPVAGRLQPLRHQPAPIGALTAHRRSGEAATEPRKAAKQADLQAQSTAQTQMGTAVGTGGGAGDGKQARTREGRARQAAGSLLVVSMAGLNKAGAASVCGRPASQLPLASLFAFLALCCVCLGGGDVHQEWLHGGYCAPQGLMEQGFAGNGIKQAD